jgi:glycosyltransferase involved in cell wall biosynthesis
MRHKIVYIISDIDNALAFEWLATGINKEQFDLSFILLNPGTSHLEEFLIQQNIPVISLRCRGKKDWLFVWLKLFVYLLQVKPDSIHCHLLQANILGLSAAKLARVPQRIYTRHHSSLHHVYHRKGILWDKLANRLASDIVAISPIVQEILEQWEKAVPSKVHFIPHGFLFDHFTHVSEERLIAIKNKYELTDTHYIVGVVSRFTEWKGIQFIIPAFQQFLKAHSHAVLLLFNAQGDYKSELLKLLGQIPPQNYRLIEFEKDMPAAFKVMNIFVHTPIDKYSEAFGQIYIEALAAGVASVFTLSGIAQDFVIDKKNALAVPFKDSESIYAAMMQLYENPSLAQQLSVEGLSIVTEKYPLHKMIQSLERLYAKEK